MTVIDELLENNRRRTEGAEPHLLDAKPARALAVVACMDCRIDVFEALGLKKGEAHIMRNAGGVVTDDVIRSLAISQRLLGTRAVMLIHHTDCGMARLSDDEFRDTLRKETGVAPAFAIESFDDAEEDVRQSIQRLRLSPFVPYTDDVRGFVFQTDTGALVEVEAAAPAQ